GDAVASSGTIDFYSFTFSSNVTGEFHCCSVNSTGSADAPRRGCLKWSIIHAAFRLIDAVVRSGPAAPCSPMAWQLMQRSCRKYATADISSGDSCIQSVGAE